MRCYSASGSWTTAAADAAIAITPAIAVLVDGLIAQGFPPREAGALIDDILRDTVLLRVLSPKPIQPPPPPNPIDFSKDAKARAAYEACVSRHPSSLPAWEDLTPHDHAVWFSKAHV